MSVITTHTQPVGDVEVFYRAAGDPAAPVILLLHGFPTSSHQYRKLIPKLAADYRVIAPDLPGFGATTATGANRPAATFDSLAAVIDGFTDAIGLDRFALYVFDYGAPVGFRLASAHPERITAIITQNGNAYSDGFSDAWAPLQAYWADGSVANREAVRGLLSEDTTRFQYNAGTPDERLDQIDPEAIAHDQAILDRDPEYQLDLFYDYRTNVAAYADWQGYLRSHQPPLLAVWGANDPFFIPAGAEAFRRDVPNAEVHLLDAGHFAAETHSDEIAAHMLDFLKRAGVADQQVDS